MEDRKSGGHARQFPLPRARLNYALFTFTLLSSLIFFFFRLLSGKSTVYMDVYLFTGGSQGHQSSCIVIFYNVLIMSVNNGKRATKSLHSTISVVNARIIILF